MAKQHATVNFVVFKKGSVFKTAEEANAKGAAGHTKTWQYAYNIQPILNWILTQSK